MESIRTLLKESKLEAVAHRNTEMLKTVSEETPVSEAMSVRTLHAARRANAAVRMQMLGFAEACERTPGPCS